MPSTPKQKSYAKTRRARNAAAGKCINTPNHKEHGPIYKGGRCLECWTRKRQAELPYSNHRCKNESGEPHGPIFKWWRCQECYAETVRVSAIRRKWTAYNRCRIRKVAWEYFLSNIYPKLA